MPTPFRATGHPIFLTYGQSNDRYCLANGLEVGYEQMLHDHLLRQGFERIVFFGNRGCYMLDQNSAELFRKKDNSPQQSTHPCPPPPGLKSGPGGFPRRQSPAPAMPAPDVQLRYRDLSQVAHMVPSIERLMRENRPKTAVILADTDIVTLLARGPMTTKMQALLKNVLPSLPTANQNIFIINVPGANPVETLRALGWDFLFTDPQSRKPGIASLVCLGPPEQDEVKNYLLTIWLKQGILVEWKSFARCCVALTAHIKSGTDELASIRLLAPYRNEKRPVNLESVRAITGATLRPPAQEQLDTMIGLKDVKAYLEEKLEGIGNIRKGTTAPGAGGVVQAEEIQRLCPRPVPAWREKLELHLALTGNAGTGKTSIARLIGELYRDAGILDLGHLVKVTRKDLVAEFVGQSAPRTAAAVQRARGGVLFIDEAYDVCRSKADDFGQEAVAALVEAMTDLKGQFMVVIAGYPDDIQRFMTMNDGLPRRISKTLLIKDYLPDELELLLRKFLADLQVPTLSPELDQGLSRLCMNFYGQRTKTSGNAGAMEQLASALVEKAGGKSAISPDDLPEEMRQHFTQEETNDQGILADLNKMIGLNTVKQAMTTMFNLRRAEQIRQGNSNAKIMPGHFLFVGKPGTGKTEVANLMARQFHALGLVEQKKLHQTSAPELIKSHVGESKDFANNFLNQGIGRVIFIDEAHQLYKSDSLMDYGKDIIDALIPFTEAHRNDCIIILAGYEDAILEMITSGDQGALSRFPNIIRFDDYTPSELVDIFDLMIADSGLEWPREELAHFLEQYFLAASVQLGPNFGNARFVRNLVGTCRANQANRLGEETNPDLFRHLTAEDFPEIG